MSSSDINCDIKFRVHDKLTGEILAYEFFNTRLNWGYYWTDAKVTEDDRVCNAGKEYYKHPSNLGILLRAQFTGLHDKNGVEIYIHDIVKVSVLGDIFVRKVEWVVDDGQVCLSICGRPSDFEVIGNIYQNPEILK